MKNQETPILSVKDLVVGHHEKCTHPISFAITTPGIYAFTGQNGSGKSTFLKTIVGLVPKISGQFNFAPHKKIAYVSQISSVNKYLHLSLKDFIIQGYGPKFSMTPQISDEIEEYARKWQLLDLMEKCFHELSSGEKTRAMVIRAFVAKPDVIFLDEPLANLDSCCQEQLMNAFANLAQEKKVCIFIADHHLNAFNSLVNHWFVFEKHHNDPLTHVHC